MYSALSAYFALASPETISAYLFGSHARGTSHRDSDIDIGVLFDDRRLSTRLERGQETDRVSAALIGVTHCNRVDVIALNDAPPELAAAILRSGRQLVCRDRGTDHDFARRIQLRAADLRPWLERTRRLTLAYVLR